MLLVDSEGHGGEDLRASLGLPRPLRGRGLKSFDVSLTHTYES